MGNRKIAVDLYNQAVSAVADKANPNHLSHGFQLFCSACYADPSFGQAFYQAGNNNSDMSLIHASVACYRRALECQNTPHDEAKIRTNLGWRLHTLGQEHEALDQTFKAIELDPSLPYAWLNLSIVHGAFGQTVVSVGAARKSFELDPADPSVEMALAFAYLFDGQYAAGLKHFEARFPYRLKNFLQYPYPKWLGEEGHTVFVVADQGLGDTLSFSRFIEAASRRASFLHLCIQPELMRLFAHAFAHLPNINLLPSPSPFPVADSWTTFMSLPFALGLTSDEIRSAPPISYPTFSMPTDWIVPDRSLHVGIAWAGSDLNEINRHRSIPVTQFLDLYKVPGIQLYSLQVDEKRKEMHDTGCAPLIRDLSGYIRDVVDTLSLLRDLDLVICCESALGHIAGLAGKETWIPYSWCGRDWRLGATGERILWYKSHRTFNQPISQKWDGVFEEIERALRKKVRAAEKREAAE